MTPTADEVIRKLAKACELLVQYGTGGDWPASKVDAWDDACALADDALGLARRYRGGWRRLRDEQPEPGQHCLVWTESNLTFGTYEVGKGFHVPWIGWDDTAYWQPLPEPPKEKP